MRIIKLQKRPMLRSVKMKFGRGFGNINPLCDVVCVEKIILLLLIFIIKLERKKRVFLKWLLMDFLSKE